MSDIDDTDDSNSVKSEQNDTNVEKLRTCTGLLKSYHGVAYQIQWLMVVAIEAKNSGKVDRFRFRTEVDYEDSGKFDDVVWEFYCVHEKKTKYNFLQAKHKLNDQQKISIKDLKAAKNPFGLTKYYVSYKTSIQNNNKYKNGLVESLIIATNVDLDEDLKFIFKESHINIPLLYDFESEVVDGRRPKCWKIDLNIINENIARIVAMLEETHDLIKIAKMLEDIIFYDKEFTVPKELHEYSHSIFKNLLSIDCTKINDNFIENKNLSNEATFLRQAFFNVAFVEKKNVYQEDAKNESSEISDYSIYDVEGFANFLASKINDAQHKNKLVNIRISKKSINYESYMWNFNRLANFVLIKKNGIKFNPKFWIRNETDSSNYFNILKNKLKCKLIEYNVINVHDTYKEISAKLDSYRFQITNFTTCMIHLVDENTFWEVVKDYNTGLSVIDNQCDFLSTKALPNYTLHKVREDIQNFFSILVFAVNFTKEILNEAVEDNFSESLKWIDNEFTAYAFRSEIANALDLTQEKIISNAEEVTQFFNKVEEETNRLILIGPTLEYCTKIELYDIEFEPNIINIPSLNCFINCEVQKLKSRQSMIDKEFDSFYRKQVLCYTTNQMLLTSIKVYHLLKSTVKYASQRNYIFMRLDSMIYLHEHVLNVFEKSINLLIIECDSEIKFDLRKICKKIIRILRSNTKKKLLLITRGNNCLTKQLKNEFNIDYCEIEDREVNFCNLEKKTKEKILQNYKIFFQGKEISLGNLTKDFENLIDSYVLCHFLNNDKIELCSLFLTEENIINYYISRDIICQKKVSNKILREESADLYAFSNIKINNFVNIAMRYENTETKIVRKITNFENVDPNELNIVKFIIVENEVQYNQLWTANKHSNVHWLVKENDYFKWNGTKGSLSNLRSYLRPRKYYSETDDKIFHELINDRLVIITADPGMGKSTFIKHLALKLKNKFPLLWVLAVDLGKFRSKLKNIVLNDNESAIKFLITLANLNIFKQIKDEDESYRNIIDWFNKQLDTKDFINDMTVKGTDLLEMFLFYNKLHKSGEVYILLDGFDEVCPKYEAEITHFIKVLKNKTMAHIWITSRAYNIINTLEDNLETVSYGIKSFNEKDQEIFLLKYWKLKLNVDNLDEHRANIFIVTLLHEFSKATNDTKRTFVGIPLQIQMLAQNRFIMFKEFYESGILTLNDEDKIKIRRGLNLVNLYNEFIDIKFNEIRFKEKKHEWPADDEDIDRMLEKYRQDFIYDHQILSIYTLYAEKRQLCSEKIKSKALSLLPSLRKAEDKNAIICGVINERPVFVHQTYAEYFAALFLWNKFQSISLQEFQNNFLHNMLNGIFFSDDKLQVCKFFYFMVDKYFNENIECIYKGNEDIKLGSILQQLLTVVTVIYNSYENRGIFSQGIDDITIVDCTGRAKHIECAFQQNPQYAQVVKLFFYMVESYITVKKSDSVIYTILKKNNPIHLLQMASEIGCINFVQTILSVRDDYDFKKWLKCSKWYFSPVWLAARNGHMEILKLLSLTINQLWTDKDDKNLAQRAYNLPELDVLRSCLLLNIINANPYSDLNYIKTLPIVHAFQNVWPLNVIELLIEKTDSHIFNTFDDGKLKPSLAICTSLLKYETSVVKSMIGKGINFFGALNILLFEFTYTSLNKPIESIKYASFYGPSFHSEQEYLRVYGLIETFLHFGVGYNSFDNVHSLTTSEYGNQIYYLHQLFKNFSEYNVNKINGIYLLLKLILIALNSYCEIVKWSNSSLLLRLKQPECSTSKRKRTYTVLERDYKTWPNSYDGITIQLIPLEKKDIFDTIGKTKEVIEKSLTIVSKYMDNASIEIKEFKKYPDSKLYNNILIGYEEMLKYHFKNNASKNKLFQSLSFCERYIFGWVLNLYIRQDYDIFEAFNEVSCDIWRYKTIKEWLQEKHNGSNVSLEETIKMFGLNLSDEDNESIHMKNKVTRTIINVFNSGALDRLLNVWNELNYVGKNLFQNVIISMSKYEQISKEIFNLFNKLDESYLLIINAIKSRKSQNLAEVLKNIDSSFVKSIVNAQDIEYGSPLHYAVFLENIDMVRILLSYNADPNQKLYNSKLLADLEDCSGKTPCDIAQEREYLNPEVYGTIKEVLGI